MSTEALMGEIDTLTATAREYQARYRLIDDFAPPADKQIIVNFTCDFDAMLLRRLLDEPAQQRAQGEFGGRVGIWRLLELFDSHDIKATIFTPGRICELYPRAVQAAAASGHEIADHMWEHRVPKSIDRETDHLSRSTAALTSTAGRAPVGTRSGHTHRLLLDAGYLYRSHDCAAHHPHYIFDRNGEHPLLNLPFHYAIDDAMFFSFAWLGSGNSAQRITDPGRVEALWWSAFRQQYRTGGYLNVCLHPFVSGRALRIQMLDRLIERMKRLPGVWFATCEETARYCLGRYPLQSLDTPQR